MADPRRALTAEQRLAERRRGLARVRRERMIREVAGPISRRMLDVLPASMLRAGRLEARVLRADRAAIIDALRDDAVFALDTAMRLAHGYGFLAGNDIHAYLASTTPLERLAEAGLIDAEPHHDTVLVRPWPGPPRILACITTDPPPSRLVNHHYRVVTADRLKRELIGAVGRRADLFALLERAEQPPHAAE